MRISVLHRTEYSYAEPVRRGVQYLRLTPRSSPVQTVREWRLDAPGDLFEWRDAFGNLCHTQALEKTIDVLSITVSGVVETSETGGVVPMDGDRLPAEAYLFGTGYTFADKRLLAFAERHRAAVARNRIDGLHALMAGVREAVDYREGETSVHTTAAEAFKDGYGVCQDHAHVFIAACRALGIPARYVSGYLWTGNNNEDHSASHGWAEALVADLGWVSFDATNKVSADERYVRVAAGFDYGAVAPIRGIRRGGGGETLAVSIQLQAQQ